MKLRLVIFCCMAALVAAIGLILVALWQRKATLDRSNRQVCLAIQNLNRLQTQQLYRSRSNLPKLAYFREHPEELRQQLHEIDLALARFRPRHC